jgi:hypothetical protein
MEIFYLWAAYALLGVFAGSLAGLLGLLMLGKACQAEVVRQHRKNSSIN